MKHWRILYSLRDRGVFGTFRHTARFAYRRVFESGFDAKHGIDTNGSIPGYELGVGREGNEYSPTPIREFNRMVAKLPIAFAQWLFVDVGCGKGRALILASAFGFGGIVGVEYSESLASVCRSNVQTAGVRADVVCANALEWPLPPKATVYFMNSPFFGSLMDRFAERLRDSPSEKYIVYWNPRCRSTFERLGFREFASGDNFAIYR